MHSREQTCSDFEIKCKAGITIPRTTDAEITKERTQRRKFILDRIASDRIEFFEKLIDNFLQQINKHTNNDNGRVKFEYTQTRREENRDRP